MIDRVKVFVRRPLRGAHPLMVAETCADFLTALWAAVPVWELRFTAEEVAVVMYAHKANVPDGELGSWAEYQVDRALDQAYTKAAARAAKEPT